MSSSFLAYLLIGRVFIFLGEKFATGNGLKGFIGRLLLCPLCLGFWIYSILSIISGIQILSDFPVNPVLSSFITGALSTFGVYVFSAGWSSLFSVIEIK